MHQEHILHFHLRMLADEARMQAYAQAIARVVRPGDVVVDLGTGTGVLAFLAARAGAARVIGIDRDEWILSQARELARINGLEDRVSFMHADILEMASFDGPVDVVISELIGNEGIDEHIFPIYRHFLSLLPVPPRALIPQSLRLHVACVHSPHLQERRHLRSVCGLDISRLSDALSHTHLVMPLPAKLAGSPALLHEGRPGFDDVPEGFSAQWDISPAQPVNGVGMWFSAHLGAGVELTSDPRQYDGSWSHALFPVFPDGPVGGRVRFELWPRMLGHLHWKWRFSWEGGCIVGDPDLLDAPESLSEWLAHWGISPP